MKKRFRTILTAILLMQGLTAYLQNAPVTMAGSAVSLNASTEITISATGFNDIGSCSLVLLYDTTVAMASAVMIDPQLGGGMNYNIAEAGKVVIGWYTFPGQTLADSSILFRISFTRVAYGSSSLAWFDDGYSCFYSDGNSNILNDLPTGDYYKNGTLTFTRDAPVLKTGSAKASQGTLIDIPVKIAGFTDIGKVELTMNFNPSVLSFQSWTNASGFPGLAVTETVPGTLVVQGTVGDTGQPVTLPDSTALYTLHFAYTDGSTELSWILNDSSCTMFGPPPSWLPLYDNPEELHYINGSVSEALGMRENEVSLQGVSFFPNPCKGNGTLCFTSPGPGQARVEIIDTRGNVISKSVADIGISGKILLPLSLTQATTQFLLINLSYQTCTKSLKASTKVILE